MVTSAHHAYGTESLDPLPANGGSADFVPDAATLSHLLDAVCIADPAWRIQFWSAGACCLFERSASDVLLKDLRSELPPAFAPLLHAIQSQLLMTGRWRDVLRFARSDGSVVDVVCQFVLERDADGAPLRILMSTTAQPEWSGSERREMVGEPLSDRFDSLFGQHPDGVLTIDRAGRIIAANPAASELTGYATHEIHAIALEALATPTQRHALRVAFDDALRGKPFAGEFVFTARDGRSYEAGLTFLPNVVDHRIIGVHGIVKDISLQKEDQRRVQYLANHDALTGLPNRRLLQTRMQHSLETARRAQARVGVLFMDLNRFKVINDSLGHDVGDALLCTIAERLKGAVRDVDTVSRIGGDEFVVVLESIEDADAILHVAYTLLRQVSLPIALGGETLTMTTSIGASVYPDDGGDTTTLLKNADLAMYAAKEAGTAFFQMYDPEMNARALARLSTENSLRDAILLGQLVLHYQPRLDLQRNRIVGVEALVRWDHPQKGLVYPNSFIPLAEETGMIDALGEWVLSSACKQMVAWRQLGLEPIKVSVNVSTIQLRSPAVCEMVTRVMQTAGFDPQLLELEITESSLMDNIEESIDTLTRLKQLGVLLAIDDFGTGYSSLTYLKRLPIGTLKIDKSFVRGLSDDKDDAAIVGATIAMAHSMDLRVVAEGVTSFEQLRFLESCRCDEIQGYLVCQPLPAEDIESYFRTCELRGIQYSWVN